MKPELTQQEMHSLTQQGKTSIWAYNTLYSIDYCQNMGNGEYYLRQVHRQTMRHGHNVTIRGRFCAMSPERAGGFRA